MVSCARNRRGFIRLPYRITSTYTQSKLFGVIQCEFLEHSASSEHTSYDESSVGADSLVLVPRSTADRLVGDGAALEQSAHMVSALSDQHVRGLDFAAVVPVVKDAGDRLAL